MFHLSDVFLWVYYRYELNDAKNSATSEHVLEVWCYEAYRLFRDRLVGADARNRFDNIMATVVRSEWSANVFDNLTCKCYGSFPLPDSTRIWIPNPMTTKYYAELSDSDPFLIVSA